MKKGFSLIELMIVVAIIAILAMIAVPNFMKFLAKAKRAEVYMNLSSIYAAEKAYWAEHGTYSSVLSGPGGIGWKPEGYKGGGAQEKFYYTYGFGTGTEGQNFFTGKVGASSSHLQPAHAGKDAFLVYAVADIDGDGDMDVVSVDQFNNIVVVHDDLAN
ncbi:MAG TPA: prepilin-type N-terminal cleavage/methylation domain-containing protein [Candidatus Limnocylindria bacterium]|nr:prepilin-type N-terminal cleavage/methylation domain-containing protein [Candidatus Limnocylindria bacterium]